MCRHLGNTKNVLLSLRLMQGTGGGDEHPLLEATKDLDKKFDKMYDELTVKIEENTVCLKNLRDTVEEINRDLGN